MEDCKICSAGFSESPDELVLCEHKEGFVHLGCCTGLCSMDGRPCMHAKGIYSKSN